MPPRWVSYSPIPIMGWEARRARTRVDELIHAEVKSGRSWFLCKWKDPITKAFINDCSSPFWKQRPFFLLFEERASCFLSSLVLYWRWQALKLALVHQPTSTGRKRRFLQGKETEASKQKECNSRHPASSLLRQEPTKPCVLLAKPLEVEPLLGIQTQQTF